MNPLISHDPARTDAVTADCPPGPAVRADSPDEIDAAMRAARVFMAVVAQSVAEVEDRVTSPQLRVLVFIDTHGPQNLGAVAADLGVHPSNATRTCERLVAAGLLDRRDNPEDRRYLLLALSREGRSLVDQLMEHRRASIAAVLERMPAELRRGMGPVLDAFAHAAGEVTEAERFAVGLKETHELQETRGPALAGTEPKS
ncbi:MarR family winged helix-turn-helix transcriptional regulator [Specibacter sp. AOP5-B1-6]|uniref:MarR family winged helix-turn-helix transcriptional regulator n=1 Tax=Specibacter sp. AOP5-B1-6 TaxID=3457653 RepID=UPI00402B2612